MCGIALSESEVGERSGSGSCVMGLANSLRLSCISSVLVLLSAWSRSSPEPISILVLGVMGRHNNIVTGGGQKPGPDVLFEKLVPYLHAQLVSLRVGLARADLVAQLDDSLDMVVLHHGKNLVGSTLVW